MDINKYTTMEKLQNIWSSEIGDFVMVQVSGQLSGLNYLADNFKKDFEAFVDTNLDNILNRLTEIDQLNFETASDKQVDPANFKTVFTHIHATNTLQVTYLLNELAFTKSAAAINMLDQSSSAESTPRGMYDASNVDKSVLMFLH